MLFIEIKSLNLVISKGICPLLPDNTFLFQLVHLENIKHVGISVKSPEKR